MTMINKFDYTVKWKKGIRNDVPMYYLFEQDHFNNNTE